MQRRTFLKSSMAGTGMLILSRSLNADVTLPTGRISPTFAKWQDPLTLPPVLYPPNTSAYPGYDYYEVAAQESTHYMSRWHADEGRGTKIWGYAGLGPGLPTLVIGRTDPTRMISAGRGGYLGGIIIAQQNHPVKVRVVNQLTSNRLRDGLPLQHPLPVDSTIAGYPSKYDISGGDQPNRIAVHLHGGRVKANSDGHPLSWFGADGHKIGQYYDTNLVPDGLRNAFTYEYPNNQSSRLMWYHDHAQSITRLNAYAGLASAYLMRDAAEQALAAAKKLPEFIETSLLGGRVPAEIPLVLQEKSFNADGSLYYHSVYAPNFWDLAPNCPTPPVPSCIPEFFGDTSVVNGTIWPYCELRQQIYRFRILNGSQARAYRLKLAWDNGSGAPNLTSTTGLPVMVQIGTEAGFLPAPVRLTGAPLTLAPGERADVLIDFSKVPVDGKLILFSQAPAPFPSGDPNNDFIDDSGFSAPGLLVQFRITGATPTQTGLTMPTTLPAVTKLSASAAKKLRDITLNEGFDDFGRLTQYLGTFEPTNLSKSNLLDTKTGGFGRAFLAEPGEEHAGYPVVTEKVKNGDTEIWTIANLTGDTHPIHFHLANVQILSRQAFDVNYFANRATAGQVRYLGAALPPDPNEAGWKETVRMNPGQITKVIMKFEESSDYVGGTYVWHCHILEHEEHDMMRELDLS